eukprot:scaffold840_cov265-Pinguiococcus_pyrenoidosus.AAC.14
MGTLPVPVSKLPPSDTARKRLRSPAPELAVSDSASPRLRRWDQRLHSNIRLLGLLLLRLLVAPDLLVAKEGQEDVVHNLHHVDVEEALIGRDEAEVHEVRRDPVAPGAHDRRRQVLLDLLLQVVHGLALGEVQVAEEHDAKDRVPRHLVDADLGEHRDHVRLGQHAVKEAVEVVAGGAVPQQTKGTHAHRAHHIKILFPLHIA